MRWIDIKKKLPNHDQIVLVYAKTNSGKDGYGVATFVDSNQMNEKLKQNGYPNECVDVSKNPFYFCSQEIRQHTFKNVSFWMEIEKP